MPLKLGHLQDLPHLFPSFRDYSLEKLVVQYLKIDVLNIYLYLSVFYLCRGQYQLKHITGLKAEVLILRVSELINGGPLV